MAVVLLAIILAAGISYWAIVPRTPTRITTYTTQQTSAATSSEEAPSTSTSSTMLVSGTTLWINVTDTRPVSYYLGLVESNGTEPYVQLARELRKIPDLTNATAVAKITHLALNATNPEVREAFELMMKGGTPDPRDFTYPVPNYNTELQVLYWLALQNEFKKDDTLALAIAMVNGLWLTMGDGQVREAVKKDTGDLLAFLRETDQMQKDRGVFELEMYPLEAKIALAWTGGLSMHWIGPLTQPKTPVRLVYYQNQRLPFIVYEMDTVSVSTLRQMRERAGRNGWWGGNVNANVASVEEHFYFKEYGLHWQFATFPELILNENGLDASLDVDWQFQRYLNGSRPKGDCGTETVFCERMGEIHGNCLGSALDV